MRLEIRRRGVEVTEELRDHLKGRLRLALGRFGRHIDSVRVYLRDVNGPRGGPGKSCRVVVGLRRGGRVVVAGAGMEVPAAITRTVGRAGFAVRRRLKRRLAQHRGGARRARIVAAADGICAYVAVRERPDGRWAYALGRTSRSTRSTCPPSSGR